MREGEETKLILILAVVFLLAGLSGGAAWAYEVNIVWEKAIGGTESDYALDADVTLDEGFVLAGGTYSCGAGEADVYLVKTDGDGNEVWDANFGGPAVDVARSVRQTSDGDFIMAGNTASFGSGDTDVYLVKTDSNGNELWSKTFNEREKDIGYCVQEVNDGGFIIAGETAYVGGSFDNNVYLIKTNASGTKLWSKTFGFSYSYERAHHVEQTSDGGFILAGYRSSGISDYYVIKTDSTGNHMWSRTYGGSDYDNGYCVLETSDGGFIIAGESRSFGEDNQLWDLYVVKTDSAGHIIWSKAYDLEGKNDHYRGLIETTNGDFVLCGDSTSYGAPGQGKAACMKINRFGNVIWSKILDNGEIAYSVMPAGDGAFVVAGQTKVFGAGSSDMYLAKLEEPLVDTALIHAEPNEFLFVARTGQGNPPPQVLELYNQGVGVLNWQIVEDCNWLQVSPVSGSSVGDTNLVTLTVDSNGLALGRYSYDLQIIDEGAANGPVNISIILVVHNGKLHVPDDFATIQGAIDIAAGGDTVVISPGVYEGEGNYDIDFKGKAITVRGANPNDSNVVALTVIDGSLIDDGLSHNGFYFYSDEDSNSVLLGLSVKGFMGDGIAISNARPVIRKCRIYGNENGISANYTPSENVETLIEDCTVSHNAGYGISYAGNVKIDNCIIENNEGSGIRAAGGCGATGDLVLEKCQISRNKYIGLDLRSIYGSVCLCDCSIIGNKGNNGGGICSCCYLTIENSVIAGNYSSYDGGAIVFYEPLVLKNCTIFGNFTERDYVLSCNGYTEADIENSIIYGNYPDSSIRFRGNYDNYVNYSNLEGGMNSIQLDSGAVLNWGLGNTDVAPCFASPGYWDANGTPDDKGDDFWVDGDYHLKSEAGRWDPNLYDRTDMNFDGIANLLDFALLADSWQKQEPNLTGDLNSDNSVDETDLDIFVDSYLTPGLPGGWVQDAATSRCIDAGNPGRGIGDERRGEDNLRINMGAYGGTAYAGKTLANWSLLADLTNDGTVNFEDYVHFACDWLKTVEEQPGDLERNSTINSGDLTLFVDDWLLETSWH
jgi:hypothetical protein